MAKIEFVKYTGSYPNFCRGTLYVKIDGKFTTFGNNYDYDENIKNKNKIMNYPCFWESGGWVRFDENWMEDVGKGPWKLAVYDEFPEDIQRLFPELIRIFNENVKWGCCGGCV